MRRKALTALLLNLAAIGAPVGSAEAAPDPLRSVAFYSDTDAPTEALSVFEDVVLQPSRASTSEVAALKKLGVDVVAALQPGAELDEPALRQLAQQGYGGFVIDACTESPERSRDLFERVRSAFPAARLFWRCPQERPPPRLREVDSVVVENVFTDADAGGNRRPLPDSTRRQVQASLKAAFLDRGVSVIALERLRPGQRALARELARELARAGIVPWLTTGPFGLGVGLVEPMPRRILGLYDSAHEPLLPFTPLHRMVALPLEYLGYVLEYWDVRRGLPGGDLAVRYAGVVTWFGGPLPHPLDYAQWLERQIDRGVRVAVFGNLGASPRPQLLSRLGLASERRPLVPPVSVAGRDDLIGQEAQPLPLTRGLPPWPVRPRPDDPSAVLTRHLDIRDSAGRIVTPVATGPWGGFAFDPYVLARGPQGSYRWLVDPFDFLQRALGLTPMPAVDVTTESGRRMLLVHIDGDGFHGRSTLPNPGPPGRSAGLGYNHPYAGEVILRDFLQVFRVPTTVSFVEGEIGPAGINPRLSPELEPIAREISSLPHVELASHTFSHPFDWLRAARDPDRPEADREAQVRLPIAGYRYSAEREVAGSVAYLNSRIAPPGKQVKTMLWSGNALPDEAALREAARLGLANVNGVNCDDPSDAPGLTQVPSLYRPVGGHLQIYAPAHNENVYIQTFRNGSPIYGFRKVIKLFEFTEKPRRLKPIDIYYHFYSGAAEAATSALREVYLWALKQETIPLHLSEYAARASAFPGVRIARRIDGSWELRGLSRVRTVRLPESLGWPDLKRSRNVIGVRPGPDGRFVSVLPGETVLLALAPQPPREPHLLSANAKVVSWTRDGGVLRFRLRGHLPVQLSVGGCAPVVKPWLQAGVSVELDRGARVTNLRFADLDTQDVVLNCER
jgi:polysaccharide biosynthesis protein PelA